MGDTAAIDSGAPSPEIEVSFVVTVYNKAPFISGMVESLRRQGDASRFEYIFVDDGSTDGSGERIAGATRDLPRVTILRQDNIGPAISTNIGVAQARGTYVKLLDADDRLVAGITPLLRDELNSSGADLLIGQLATYRLGGIMPDDAPLVGRVQELEDPLMTVLETGLSNTSATIFRRAACLAAGGCDETVFIQDYSMFLRMARRSRFLTSDAVFAYVPENAIGRVSGIAGQALHDTNRALLNLIVADPVLPARYKLVAMRRAAGRAWKWALRHRGATLLSCPFFVHAISRLPIAALAPWVLRHACRPFRADTALRFPGPPV